MNKLKVAIVFGGKSTEHEISIITGLQVFNNIDREKFEPIAVYVTKDGRWFAGEGRLEKVETYKDLVKAVAGLKNTFLSPDTSVSGLVEDPSSSHGLFSKLKYLKIDVLFPCFHGTYGEDGAAQGLFDLSGIPYVGCGTLASAVTMDKILCKAILDDFGVPVVKGHHFLVQDWEADKKSILDNCEEKLKYPMFVKPPSGGSSIGVTRAENRKGLEEAIEIAKFYDRRILVEEGVKDAKEVNVSVIGHEEIEVSEVEMPVASSNVLSYEDKYTSGGGKSSGMASLKRIIPAPIKADTKKEIEEIARQTFRLLDCSGIIRIDFLLTPNEKQIWVNEVNPLPGSIAFYLWEPKGLKIKELITKLINLALERHEERAKLLRTFPTNVLESFSGSKGKS
ncbi:MAG: D-alanine-D-alanine ligase [Microgenomates group bacterium Gr01-1014_5]|nr:MAG: D-alanine-D-alanine ligase [Microgenomates group bacterium Gr01-1014_5]